MRDRRAAFEHAVAALPNRASRLQPLVSLSHLQPLRSFRYPAARRFVCRGPLLNPQCDDGALGALEEEHDDDVAAEEARLRGGDSSGALRVLGLRKVYAKRDARNRRTKFSAVKDLWFAIPKGEVFGFLGVNGAGKSTTLKMLSGDVIPTSGTAEMGGFDILNEQVAVRRLLVEEHVQHHLVRKGAQRGHRARRHRRPTRSFVRLFCFRRQGRQLRRQPELLARCDEGGAEVGVARVADALLLVLRRHPPRLAAALVAH